MKMRYLNKGAFLLGVLLVALPSFSSAESVTVFGPETFSRTTGPPNRFERSFPLPAGVGAPFKLKVTNGTPEGKNRISSASVYVNGVEVVKESDFNQQVGVIEKPITLGAENTLGVELRSNPGGLIAVEVSGTSTFPSIKKVIGPEGGTIELQGTKNRVKVEIPAYALVSDTEMTIREVPTPSPDYFWQEGVPIGSAFSFEPHGLRFLRVVTISFTYRDEDLPQGTDEGDILIVIGDPDGYFHAEGGAVCDPLEEPGPHCVDTESIAQDIDTDRNIVSVSVNTLSMRLLQVKMALIKGCNGRKGEQPTIETLTADGFKLPILRCLRPGVSSRPPGAVIKKIVIHSTNNGNVTRKFANEITDCAIEPAKCKYSAHYYIDRDGTIVQVALDDQKALHAGRRNESLDVDNDNSVGIELFNNVGEPYNGMEIASLIRLVDMLVRLHPDIERPDPALPRTSTFSHAEVSNGKCDPVGIFRTSSKIWYVEKKQCAVTPLPGGSPDASTLFDAVLAGVYAMGEDLQGLIHTSGGDSLGLAYAGRGGDLRFSAGAIPPLPSGINYTENNPLIVPPTMTLPLTGNHYTDIIIDGTLEITGDIAINVSGTLFIAPEGKIVTSNGMNGGSMTLNTNGTPLIHGVLDASGRNGEIMPSNGGNGGTVSLSMAADGPLLVPTLVTRGGDADEAAVLAYPLASQGGRGGDVLLTSLVGDLFLSGGPPPTDTLPPPPPFNLSSIGTLRPDPGQRVPLKKAAFQVGFTRGILTSGGMGGSGIGTSPDNQAGGRGGDGGHLTIRAEGAGTVIAFRDVDLITGADVEMIFSQIYLPDFWGATNTYFAGTGSLGGKGSLAGSLSGGNGGEGGAAGSITVVGTLQPTPVSFRVVGGPFGTGNIIGFHDGPRPRWTDDPLSDFVIGQTIQAEGPAVGGQPPPRLYRLRVDGVGQAVGGSGGIPGGKATSFPGLFGRQGAGGTISGLR